MLWSLLNQSNELYPSEWKMKELNKKVKVYLIFIMNNDILHTPRRLKPTTDYLSDRRYKHSTIESRMSRDSKLSKGIITNM